MGIKGGLENALKNTNWEVGINWGGGLKNRTYGYCKEQLRMTDL